MEAKESSSYSPVKGSKNSNYLLISKFIIIY